MKRTTMLLGAGMLLFCSMFTALAPSEAFGAVPQLINFQGILRDGDGNPVADGSHTMIVKIYDAASGTNPPLWSDNFTVSTAGGLFNVILGSGAALPATLFSNSNLWVGVTVGTDPEATPRTQLTSVPYSARVGTVDGATGGVISGDVSIQSNLNVAGSFKVQSLPGVNETQTIIRGAAGETANLLEIQNDLGVPLVSVDPGGAMKWPNLVLANPGPGGTPLSIQGAAGQTANLMEIKDGTGATLVSCASDGIIATPAIQLTSFSNSTISNFPNPVPIEIKTSKGSIFIGRDDGILQQVSADPGASLTKLQEWKNGAGTPVASIDPAGNMTIDGDMDGLNSTWENLQAIDINCDGTLNTVGDVNVGGNVGIGTAIANSKLHVGGAIATGVTFVSSPPFSITLDASHSIILCNSPGSAIVVNLPTATGIAGRQYTIKLISSVGGVIIDPFGGETIEGAATRALSGGGQYVTIVSDGATWWIVANN